MSRSRPDPLADPNPAGRWHEWRNGALCYYDKAAAKRIDVPAGFTFLLLDQLSSIRGWHGLSGSAIYANEIRDTRTEDLIVRAFKAGELVRGKYTDIKARVKDLGAKYAAHCYIAWKADTGELRLGAIRWQGAALGAWSEFLKASGKATVYARAVQITGTVDGINGGIRFKVPAFALKATSAATEASAKALDEGLQRYLERYLARDGRAAAADPDVVTVDAAAEVEADPIDREPGEEVDPIDPAGGECRWCGGVHEGGPEQCAAVEAPAWVTEPGPPVEAREPVPFETPFEDSDIPF